MVNAWFMLLVVVQVPVAGLYIAQLASTVVVVELTLFPPTTRTEPVGSSAATCSWRTEGMFPVVAYVPVTGLYSSAFEMLTPFTFSPPAMRMKPLFSNVAVWPERGVINLPVKLNVPVAAL